MCAAKADTKQVGGECSPTEPLKEAYKMASTETTEMPPSHVNTCSTNPSWKAAALQAAMRVARRQARFTAHDVLQELAKSNVRTADLRAIGAVMRQARDLGFVSSAGPVRRNDHTRNFTTLWESRLVGQSSDAIAPEPQ